MKTLLSIVAFVFAASIYWAMSIKPLSESADLLFNDPWGVVTLLDLYIGFFLFIIFMYITIPKKNYLLLWAPSLLVLGNIVSLVYIVYYFSRLKNLGSKNESL